MTTASTPMADNGRAQPHLSWLLVLIGPALLVLGGALAIAGLFFPWYHYDPRAIQPGDPYPSDYAPYTPAFSFGGLRNADTLVLLALAAVPATAGLICLLIDILPPLRRRWLLGTSGLLLGTIALVTGLAGAGLVALYGAFINAAFAFHQQTPWVLHSQQSGALPGLFIIALTHFYDVKVLDSGYYLSLLGYISLLPGAILLMVGQHQLRAAVQSTPVGQVARAPRPKSLGVAVLLEWLVPGLGASYVEQPGIGTGWFAGTTLGGLVLGILIFAIINSIDELGSFPYQPINVFPAVSIGVILFSLGVGWLVARLWAVAGQVRAFNQQIASGAAGAMPARQLPFLDGQAISSTALALLLSLIMLCITILPSFFGLSFPALLAVAFWLALVRLPQVSARRALLETLAGLVVMRLMVLVLSFQIERLQSLSFAPLHSSVLLDLPGFLLSGFALPIAVACGIGWGAALLFAPWQRVREQHIADNGLVAAAIGLAMGVVASLWLYAWRLGLLQPLPDTSAGLGNTSYGTTYLSYFLLTLAICAGGILTAAVITRLRLYRLFTTSS